MINKFKIRDIKKIETEKKERIVQTYLIIATLLVTFNQNIVITLNNTTSTSTASQESNYILAFFTIFIVSILIYNTLLTFTHDEIYLRGAKNFIAIIASSCLSSILINYIIIQGRINVIHLDDNIINQMFSNVQIFIIVYLILLVFISLPLLFIQGNITVIFKRVTETTSKKVKDIISINNFIYTVIILLLQYSVYYTLKIIF